MFQGSIVALVTPMHENGDIDFSSLENLIEFHINAGTDAIVAVGTTGESATIDFDEHKKLIKRFVEIANKRIPIIAGTGANSTAEAIALTASAKESGADACLLVTPYYNKPTQEGLYQHFKAIAEAVDIPQILYNVPGRTAVDMLAATVQRLSTIDNIIGIKEATGSIERAQEIIALCDDSFELYTGDDATAMECILAGARGDISVTANVVPKIMHDMCTAAFNGDKVLAAELNAKIEILHNKLFVESNPIPAKYALTKMGMMPKGLRLPLTYLSSECHDEVDQALKQVGVID
jgi:4-hydroxy-tetrahydrodipicolinate synthase